MSSLTNYNSKSILSIFECRYCLSDEDTDNIINPCDCIGSLKYVHNFCLEQWIKINKKELKTLEGNIHYSKCELCKGDIKMKITYKNGVIYSILKMISNIITGVKNTFYSILHIVTIKLIIYRIRRIFKDSYDFRTLDFTKLNSGEIMHDIFIFMTIMMIINEISWYYINMFLKLRKRRFQFFKKSN